MRVIKILNNSLLLIKDEQGQEMIVMGKGLAFKGKVGERLDEEHIQKRFILQNNPSAQAYVRTIENMPEKHVNVINKLITNAKEKLSLDDQIFFTLMDHLSFAIERWKKGVALQNRMLWEIQRFHPVEFALGLEAVQMLNLELGVELPEEEAGNIAFHFVNAQTHEQNMERTMQSVKMLKDIFNLIQYTFDMQLNKNSIHYVRLVTHLQFFIQRLQEGRLGNSAKDFIFQHMVKEHPLEYKCAEMIKTYVQNMLDISISNEELLYLMIHIARIVQEDQGHEGRL
ncbi:beta-glucoside operon transcriptional antiterminator [Paenibacillus xylanexedens]|uniref:PRD domain-containing protein n=1 Tax=Paenibacillus xylanexedens TaxID=528191 RepID=UPI00209FDE9F|nr:PRD domain-containing protein [Paenibacillus xylanexedens]MCP1427105.1 beta-glucoside operon transcriptional antiterminator [Paenibacillus xylanexedens]